LPITTARGGTSRVTKALAITASFPTVKRTAIRRWPLHRRTHPG
jgi:hypothetical protein